MYRLRQLAVSFALLFFSLMFLAVRPANAAVVLSSMSATDFFAFHNIASFDAGAFFTVPAGQDYLLNSYQVRISSTGGRTYTATLHDGTGNVIGGLISSIQTVTGTGAGTVTFTAGSPIPLIAGQTYAVVITGTGGGFQHGSTLPTGTFTFVQGFLRDKSTGSVYYLPSWSMAIELDASPYIAPIASFTSASSGLSAAFTDTSMNVPTTWAWDFGDGNSDSVQNPSHTYAALGLYNVCMTSSNIKGTSAPFCQTVGVGGFSNSGFSTYINGLDVWFTDSSSDSPSGWAWDFGDGRTSGEQHPSHTYSAEGEYRVCLTVANGLGTGTTFCTLVRVERIYSLNDWNAGARETRAYAYGIPENVYAVVLMENNQWLLNTVPNSIPSALSDAGVILAVEVYALNGGYGSDDFGGYQQICLQGEGRLIFLDGATSPRQMSEITPTTVENGYTCGWIPNGGTLVLIEG